MSKQLEKLRREAEKRRNQTNWSRRPRNQLKPVFMSRHEEAREDPEYYYLKETSSEKKSYESKHYFTLRALIAVCLFLLIAILFKTNVPQLEKVRQVVQHSYEQEFQFASIAHWYEDQFGRPLALIPTNQELAQGNPNEEVEMNYALPANGVISEDFEKNGQGILIETQIDAEIEAVRGGYVISIGEDEGSNLGKTVVVQHYDGAESIYGMLSDIKVNVYDHIQAGDKIGMVSNEEGERGIFYFALKQDDQYINPSRVLSFD